MKNQKTKAEALISERRDGNFIHSLQEIKDAIQEEFNLSKGVPFSLEIMFYVAGSSRNDKKQIFDFIFSKIGLDLFGTYGAQGSNFLLRLLSRQKDAWFFRYVFNALTHHFNRQKIIDLFKSVDLGGSNFFHALTANPNLTSEIFEYCCQQFVFISIENLGLINQVNNVGLKPINLLNLNPKKELVSNIFTHYQSLATPNQQQTDKLIVDTQTGTKRKFKDILDDEKEEEKEEGEINSDDSKSENYSAKKLKLKEEEIKQQEANLKLREEAVILKEKNLELQKQILESESQLEKHKQRSTDTQIKESTTQLPMGSGTYKTINQNLQVPLSTATPVLLTSLPNSQNQNNNQTSAKPITEVRKSFTQTFLAELKPIIIDFINKDILPFLNGINRTKAGKSFVPISLYFNKVKRDFTEINSQKILGKDCDNSTDLYFMKQLFAFCQTWQNGSKTPLSIQVLKQLEIYTMKLESWTVPYKLPVSNNSTTAFSPDPFMMLNGSDVRNTRQDINTHNQYYQSLLSNHHTTTSFPGHFAMSNSSGGRNTIQKEHLNAHKQYSQSSLSNNNTTSSSPAHFTMPNFSNVSKTVEKVDIILHKKYCQEAKALVNKLLATLSKISIDFVQLIDQTALKEFLGLIIKKDQAWILKDEYFGEKRESFEDEYGALKTLSDFFEQNPQIKIEKNHLIKYLSYFLNLVQQPQLQNTYQK